MAPGRRAAARRSSENLLGVGCKPVADLQERPADAPVGLEARPHQPGGPQPAVEVGGGEPAAVGEDEGGSVVGAWQTQLAAQLEAAPRVNNVWQVRHPARDYLLPRFVLGQQRLTQP